MLDRTLSNLSGKNEERWKCEEMRPKLCGNCKHVEPGEYAFWCPIHEVMVTYVHACSSHSSKGSANK